MAISLGDALLKMGVDKKDFDRAVKESQETIKTASEKMSTNLRMVGAAFTAIGVAGLKAVSDAKSLNAELGQTALTIGATTKEMRDLALATTDVTFPLSSVAATFDLLARAGVESTEEIQKSAKAFDALADATDSSAEVVADMLLPAFKLFGEAIPTTSAELDKFTWMTKNTLVDLSDFGTLLTRMAPYMDTLNMSMDDAIATLAALGERGITGTAATLKLRTAITQAASSGQDLSDVLGITQEEIDGFREQMAGAEGITQQYADVANTQYSLMDKIKQKFSELSLVAGSFLEPMEPLLGIMAALGPAMILLSTSAGQAAVAWVAHTAAVVASAAAHAVLHPIMTAQVVITKAVTAAQWLWNAALTANPIGIVIVAIGALVAAGIALWKNWDKVVRFFKDAWSVMKIAALTGVKWILDALAKLMGWIPGLGTKIKEARDAIANMIDAEKVARDARHLNEAITKRAEELTEVIREELEKRREEQLKDLADQTDAANKAYDENIKNIQATYGILEREDENYVETKLDAARRMTEEQRKQYNTDLDNANTAHSAKLQMIDAEYAAKLKLLDDGAKEQIKALQAQIDLISETTEEENAIIREQEREQRLLDMQAAVDSAKTATERNDKIRELEEYRTELERERLLESRQSEQDALRDQIEDIQEQADTERDLLEEERDAKKAHETELYNQLAERLEQERDALDGALAAELIRIDNERIANEIAQQEILDATIARLNAEDAALRAHYDHRLEETQLHAAAMAAATSEIMGVPQVQSNVSVGPLPPGYEKLPGYAQGGPIKEDTMLYGLKSMQPYAIAHAGESVVPASGGGYRTANIILELDGQTLARVIGQPLIDELRIRQGLRI